MIRSRCPHCKGRLELRERIHEACIGPWADAQAAKAERTALKRAKAAQQEEKRQDRVKKERMKSIAQLIAEAQKEFNLYCRLRDHDKPCICCGRTETAVDGLTAHGWDCGHYRSTGSASHLRFNPDNAHRQLVFCNRYGAGRAVEYRKGLIERIGLERVEALENSNQPHKWTADELRAIKAEYMAKAKELRNELK